MIVALRSLLFYPLWHKGHIQRGCSNPILLMGKQSGGRLRGVNTASQLPNVMMKAQNPGRDETFKALIECHRHLARQLKKAGNVPTSEQIILDSFRLSLSFLIKDWHRPINAADLKRLVAVRPAQPHGRSTFRFVHETEEALQKFLVFARECVRGKKIKQPMNEKEQGRVSAVAHENDLQNDLGSDFFSFQPLDEKEQLEFSASLSDRRRKSITALKDSLRQSSAA